MLKKLGLCSLLLVGAVGCSLFEDPTPEQVNFRMSGSDGMTVMAIYAKDFVAGTNELGGTQVEVFGTDTVMHVLPIDTIIDIKASSQFFVQVEAADTVAVSVIVDVDTRNVLSQQGGIFPGMPWRYVYQFNQFLGEITEVII